MDLVATFGFVLLMLALGRALAWKGLLTDAAPPVINTIVLFVCLPAAILRHAPSLEFEPALIGVIAVPWLILAVGVVAILGLAKLLDLGRPVTAALLMLATLGNTSFLGFSVIPGLAGAGALRYAVIYDQFGSFLQLSTFGVIVLAVHGGEQRPRAAEIAKRVLGFPPFLVLVLAVTVMPSSYPPLIEEGLARLEGALLPLVALAIGVQLRLRVAREHVLPLGIGLIAKLIVAPALALGFCLALGLEGDMRAACVFEAAMPSMITAGALLAGAGLAGELAAGLVGVGILASMVTLPCWWWVLSLVG
ncbi:AEC family transporter [Nannocystaceae bacterium ST9]